MFEDATLADKVTLVTGAGSGIGRASALAFAQAGAKVVASDVDGKGGLETVRLICDAGGEAIFVRADVSKSSDVANMVRLTVAEYGRLDIAHNNAGVESANASILDSSEEDWDRVIDINLKGVWLSMKHEIPAMLDQGGGSIVNTSSTVGHLGQSNMASYVASKHGVIGLTRAIALEFVDAGIRVNAVCPAVVATSMFERFTRGDDHVASTLISSLPMKRLIEPQEVANAVLWLSSDKAAYLNGHALVIDGGLSIQ